MSLTCFRGVFGDLNEVRLFRGQVEDDAPDCVPAELCNRVVAAFTGHENQTLATCGKIAVAKRDRVCEAVLLDGVHELLQSLGLLVLVHVLTNLRENRDVLQGDVLHTTIGRVVNSALGDGLYGLVDSVKRHVEKGLGHVETFPGDLLA